MRFNTSLTIRLIVFGAFALIGIFVAAVAWAQSNPDDPEGNTSSPSTPAVNNAVDEAELQAISAAPAGEVILFESIAGSSFFPRESTTTSSYGNAGCTYKTKSSGYLVSDLQLPEGAVIDFISLYFYDNNANNNAHLWLYAYDGMGNYTEIATVFSSGTPGQGAVSSAPFSYVVDNASESLGLVAGADSASDNTVRICRARIRYRVQVPSYQFLPGVLK